MTTQTQPIEERSKLLAAATKPTPKNIDPDFQRLLEEKGQVTYKPYGAEDEITLTVKRVQEFLAVRTTSGRTCSDRDARRFVMLCQAQRLNPWAGDAYLIGYDRKAWGDQPAEAVFSLITAHQVFLKRAEASPDFDGMESGVILRTKDGILEREGDFADFQIDEKGNWESGEEVIGGWAKVYRKNITKPFYRRLSVQAMRPRYDTPFWSDAKAPGQVCKCAEGDALRSAFPSLLGGLYMHEEQYDITRIVSQGKGDNGRFETSKLVESVPAPPKVDPPRKPESATEDDGDLGPQSPTPPPAKPEPSDQAKELAAFLHDNEFSFDQLRNWMAKEEFAPGLDLGSLAGVDDLPAAIVVRLVRARKGLKDGLKQMKGEKA